MDERSINRGLMQYTYDWMQKLGKDITVCEALRETSKRWPDFSAEIRAKYECNQVSSFILPDYKENESLKSNMRDDISIHLRTTVKSNEIQLARFFFISFNFFGASDLDSWHMPAEVSVCAYSMKKGLIKIYTEHINPQTNLFGAYHVVHAHSEQSHQLPLPPNGLGTKNLQQVYLNIIRFLKEYNYPIYQDSSALPPLYTTIEHLPVAKSCCKYLHSLVPKQPEMVLYAIQYLGDELITRSMNPTTKQYNSFEIEFERDKFEYEDGLACAFHENRDRSRYCTQNQVVRWSYTLSNYLSNMFNFTKYPTFHYPPIFHPIESESETQTIAIDDDSDYIQDPGNIQSSNNIGTNKFLNDEKSSDAVCDSSKYGRPRNPIYP